MNIFLSLKYLRYMFLIVIIFGLLKLIYDYNIVEPNETFQSNDIIDVIHQKKLKAVQLLNERFTWTNWGFGSLGEFPFRNCVEKRCFAFKEHKYLQKPNQKSDGVMVHVPNLFYFDRNGYKRNRKQLWLFYTMESQRRTFCSLHYKIEDLDDWFNLTATFKPDSSLLSDYKEFKNWNMLKYNINYLSDFKKFLNTQADLTTHISAQVANKNKANVNSFVFWYVSNCQTPGRRENYMLELLSHLNVDIYGSCSSTFKTSKNDPCERSLDKEKCDFELYTSYKFYLAFENGLCNNYITEKFWKIYTSQRLFRMHIIPVVRGARDSQYKQIALKNSYINADNFNSPKLLAEYLTYLNTNNTAYMEYFNSKIELFEELKDYVNKTAQANQTVQLFIPQRDDFTPFCEMCSKLHDETYLNNTNNPIIKISKWFNPKYECWDEEEPNFIFRWVAKLVGYCV